MQQGGWLTRHRRWRRVASSLSSPSDWESPLLERLDSHSPLCSARAAVPSSHAACSSSRSSLIEWCVCGGRCCAALHCGCGEPRGEATLARNWAAARCLTLSESRPSAVAPSRSHSSHRHQQQRQGRNSRRRPDERRESGRQRTVTGQQLPLRAESGRRTRRAKSKNEPRRLVSRTSHHSDSTRAHTQVRRIVSTAFMSAFVAVTSWRIELWLFGLDAFCLENGKLSVQFFASTTLRMQVQITETVELYMHLFTGRVIELVCCHVDAGDADQDWDVWRNEAPCVARPPRFEFFLSFFCLFFCPVHFPSRRLHVCRRALPVRSLLFGGRSRARSLVVCRSAALGCVPGACSGRSGRLTLTRRPLHPLHPSPPLTRAHSWIRSHDRFTSFD